MSLKKYTIDGEWLVMADGHAMLAQGREVCFHADAEARLALMQRAVNWLLDNAGERLPDGSLVFHEPDTVAPAELAEIIKGGKP